MIHWISAKLPTMFLIGNDAFTFQHVEIINKICLNSVMKLIAKIKLSPTQEQAHLLLRTIETANDACNYISQQAWQAKSFGRVPVHKLCYYKVREQFTLSAQVAVRCIGKVVDAYKLNKNHPCVFRKYGAISYDSRILTYYYKEKRISIWTISGRENIPYQAGEKQLALLEHQVGETDLVYMNKNFYLYATCDVDDPKPFEINDVIGLDLGVNNIAVDSDGDIHRGNHITNVRIRYVRLRAKLQSKGTKSAKRLLRKRNKRESRFSKDLNHCISKKVVQKAERTTRGIAMEKLSSIRDRIRAKKPQRYLLHTWTFADLQSKIRYKAQRAGVTVVFVNPAYTSQTCSCCGHVDKHNRQSQSVFLCISCGFAAHADVNAAQNIRILGRASVNTPDADSV
jgi:putative transposase